MRLGIDVGKWSDFDWSEPAVKPLEQSALPPEKPSKTVESAHDRVNECNRDFSPTIRARPQKFEDGRGRYFRVKGMIKIPQAIPIVVEIGSADTRLPNGPHPKAQKMSGNVLPSVPPIPADSK